MGALLRVSRDGGDPADLGLDRLHARIDVGLGSEQRLGTVEGTHARQGIVGEIRLVEGGRDVPGVPVAISVILC